MEQQGKTPNWMKYPSLLRLYQQVQDAECGLEPDPEFLKDPRLGRYEEYQLKHLEIPENIKNFLKQVGLPDRFLGHRSPSEEKENEKSTCPGVIFWVSCLRVETVKRKKYLVIGEFRGLSRTCTTTNFGKPDQTDKWNKLEELTPVVVELKTGSVWRWIHYSDEDMLTFVNSSLEQYLLSMAYWQAFYPEFAAKVTNYLKRNPGKTELSYIFWNQKRLYAPFRKILEQLDPDALKKRRTYWKFMCDLSLI